MASFMAPFYQSGDPTVSFNYSEMNWKERLQKQNPEEIVPFVDGWDFVGILGEGAFGEVRLGRITQTFQKPTF